MKKRFMALAICFVLVAVLLPVSANAYTNHSQAEAVQWIKDRGNESWWKDMDNTAGCQCVDLVKAYYQYLVGYQVLSNAYEYWKNDLPDGWYRNNTPTPGCIVCWKAYSDTGSGWSTSQYGHIGLVYKVSGSNVYTVETNIGVPEGYSGKKGYSNAKFCVRHPKNAIYIHPDFKGSTPPPSITYTNIEEGTYYLRNVSNGKYLQVSYGTDANKQNVDTYDFRLNGKNNLMSITKTNNGYKIRPLCSSSRVINIYASTVASGNNVNLYDNGNNSTQWWKFQSVSGGFVVRNVQNSDVCMNLKDGWDVNVLNYTGSNNQKWQIQNSVQYNANGGSDAPAYQLKNYGEPLTLSNDIPTRSGYAFAGWSADENAVAAEYQPGDSYTANSNATLYAVWVQQNFTVTYNANGGTGAPSSQTKEYGKELTLSSVIPTRSGYTFAGWGLNNNETIAKYQPGDIYSSDANLSLFAIWKENTPTLSSIIIAENPNKTTYEIGESLDTAGLSLRLTYSDGSTKTITSGYTVSGFNSVTAGTKTVTVSYGGKTTTFKVTVQAHSTGYEKGDIDRSRNVSNSDLILMARHVVKLITLTGEQFRLADMNDDGVITNQDIITLARKIVGLA